jgi:hypothetical protein
MESRRNRLRKILYEDLLSGIWNYKVNWNLNAYLDSFQRLPHLFDELSVPADRLALAAAQRLSSMSARIRVLRPADREPRQFTAIADRQFVRSYGHVFRRLS